MSEIAEYQPEARISVIGHSYGSLVTGLAARDGLAADAVVLIGSPGSGVDSVTEFAVAGTRPEVYVGYVSGDAVPTWSDMARKDEGGRFGQIPYDEAFGADEVRFFSDNGGKNPHSAYYLDDSSQLRWMAGIVSP